MRGLVEECKWLFEVYISTKQIYENKNDKNDKQDQIKAI